MRLPLSFLICSVTSYTDHLRWAEATGKKARSLVMDFAQLDGPHWYAFQSEVENLDVGVLGACFTRFTIFHAAHSRDARQ